MRNISKELTFGLLITLMIFGLIFFQFNKNSKLNRSPVFERKIEKATNSKKYISLEEVAKHSKKDDCYMIIEKKVYDLTSYIDKHPGGIIITRFCGKDGTQAFNSRGKNKEPHSPKAREILKNYYIGDLE